MAYQYWPDLLYQCFPTYIKINIIDLNQKKKNRTEAFSLVDFWFHI